MAAAPVDVELDSTSMTPRRRFLFRPAKMSGSGHGRKVPSGWRRDDVSHLIAARRDADVVDRSKQHPLIERYESFTVPGLGTLGTLGTPEEPGDVVRKRTGTAPRNR